VDAVVLNAECLLLPPEIGQGLQTKLMQFTEFLPGIKRNYFMTSINMPYVNANPGAF
jgi:hypothetical protein